MKMKTSYWAKVAFAGALVFLFGQALAAASVEQLRASGARVVADTKTGVTRFVGFDAQPVVARQSANATLQQMPAEAAAAQHLSNYAGLFGLRDAASETRTIKHRVGKDGRSMTRYQQNYLGIPVIAGELIVNQTAQRQLTSISGKISPQLTLDTTPLITAQQAKTIARQAMVKWYQLPADEFVMPEPTLSIYDSRLMSPHATPAALVWRVDVMTKGVRPINEFMAVDAKTGGIALHFNQVPHAKNRMTYDAANTTVLPGTLVCNESNPTCAGGIQDAVDAHRYAGATYDFYATNFGRDGIDGAGMMMISSVRICQAGQPCPFANAFWDGTQMSYGQGFSNAEDVVAHELTHGVTEHESNLFYYYQSGAIDESLSDVFGEFIQQSDPSGTVTPANKWLIGEDLTGGALRSMSNPPAYGDPDRMTGGKYYVGTGDQGGVHINSGINNKAAYLMVDGGVFNGRTVTAIGLTKTAKIYYRVQTVLLTSGSDYSDLHNALYQACQDLIGTDGVSSADCQSVLNATDAVEMNLQPTPGFNPQAAQCPAGQSISSTIFGDDLERGGNNWLFTHTVGSESWSIASGYATSGRHSLFGLDPAYPSDLMASMASGVTLPANAHLWFNHAFGFDTSPGTYYDGGVLEYSSDGGSTWLDAGGLFAEGKGYGGLLSSGASNPLEGRSAFVAESHGYVSSRYNLSALAGQTVRFRWRVGSDAFVGAQGWDVDDVRIHVCAAGAATMPSAPTIGTATAGDARATIPFTPGAIGSGTLVNYTATCSSDDVNFIAATAASSPVTVAGLSNGVTYHCWTKTASSVGDSPWSAQSNSVTPSGMPDLIVTSVIAPASSQAGGSVFVTATVMNQGSASAGASWLEFYLSTDSTISVSDIDTTYGCYIPPLVPGQTYSSCQGNIGIPATTPSGTYYVGAITDAKGQVSESNENNNTRTAANTTAIGTTTIAPSNLSACSLSATPASISAGSSATLTASCTPAVSSYVWTGGTCAGTSAASCTVTPAATTAYSVAGVNIGSTSNSASATVTVLALSIIDHYYQNILNRAADAGGKTFWQSEVTRMNGLGINATEAYIAMASYFFTSSEFIARSFSDDQFVQNLYLTFFNRVADQGGLDYWKGVLASQLPRDMLMYSFMFSPEFNSFMTQNVGSGTQRAEVGAVVDYYRGAFGRLPDDGGLKYWVNQFRNAQCSGDPAGSVYSTTISMAGGFFGSADYLSGSPTASKYVSDLYNTFLRRGVDLAGFNYWANQLSTNAQTYDQVRRSFINSPEFAVRVQAIVNQGCTTLMQ